LCYLRPNRTPGLGSSSAKAKYDVSSLRKLAAKELTLHEVARVSVLHSSILDYMVKLANERYDILASWPDFTTAVRRDGPILRAARLWLSKEFLGFFHHLHQIWGKKHQWSPLCFGSQLFPLSPQHSSPSSRPFVLLQYGKDFYYRAHPEDLKKFYAAVDEFHRIYDVVTEFESLNGLASEVIPGACACGWEALSPSALGAWRMPPEMHGT
jgi:hypothetical protein